MIFDRNMEGVLETDATNSVVYRILEPSDAASAIPVFAQAFFEGEPVTGSCGCTLADHVAFCSLYVPRMAEEGNSIVAVDSKSGALLGGFLCEDYSQPDPPGIEAFLDKADGDWGPVFAMIGELEVKLGEASAIPADVAKVRKSSNTRMQTASLITSASACCILM